MNVKSSHFLNINVRLTSMLLQPYFNGSNVVVLEGCNQKFNGAGEGGKQAEKPVLELLWGSREHVRQKNVQI